MVPGKHSGDDLIEDEDQGGWIVTYADLMTLLMVFFVMLYAISSLNLQKFEEVMSSIRINLGEGRPAIDLYEISETPGRQERQTSPAEMSGLISRERLMLNDIDNAIEEKRLGDHIIATMSQGKIHIQIKGKVLFASGSADLNKDAEPILDKIIGIINSYEEYTVNIKGHTDNTPIATAQFASNWELSAIRSTSVLKYLIKQGVDPDRLTATGYGEIFPLVPNTTAENKALNRRVEFVLEK